MEQRTIATCRKCGIIKKCSHSNDSCENNLQFLFQVSKNQSNVDTKLNRYWRNTQRGKVVVPAALNVHFWLCPNQCHCLYSPVTFYLELGLLCKELIASLTTLLPKVLRTFMQPAIKARHQKDENPNSRIAAETARIAIKVWMAVDIQLKGIGMMKRHMQ